MKKILTLTLGLSAMAFGAHAQEILNEDFSGYADGNIDGVSGWLSTTNGHINQVVSGELMLDPVGDRVMFSGAGADLGFGDSVQITVDYRLVVDSTRKHSGCFGFGIQTNSAATAASQDELINTYTFIFGLEPDNRNDGQVNQMPDSQQWTGPGTYVMEAIADYGMNPYGYYTNESPYDSVAEIDADSDMMRAIYSITKSHVSNMFNVVISTSNLTSGATSSGSDTGIVRPAAWEGSDLFLTLYSNGDGNTNYIQSVKMEKLPPVIAAPTGVSALGLDGEVSVTWSVMPGATQYDVYRDGGYLWAASSESFTDTTVVNGTAYSYTVVAKYSNGESAQSSAAVATPQSIYSDQEVYATDFSDITPGDLAADINWGEISGTSNNAFAVINDTADTIAVESYFTNTVGNGVFLDKLVRNMTDDAVEGFFDVVISSTASGTNDADHTHQTVMTFGLTSSTAEVPAQNKDMMALFGLKIRHESRLLLQFGEDNLKENTALAVLQFGELGWNPKPNSGQSWVGTPGAIDLETDPLRVSWEIRKTREDGVYQAWGSVSNLTTGFSDEDSIEYRTASRSALYESQAAAFSMTHSPTAHLDDKYSTLHLTVDQLSLSHSSGNGPIVEAPVVTSVLSGDREVVIDWDPVLDATGGYTLTVETPEGEVYVVADGITETTYTDSPRWNDIVNSYTLAANFDSDVTPSVVVTNFDAAPIGLEPVVHLNGGYGTAKNDYHGNGTATTNANLRYFDHMTTPMFENGVGSYTGPTLYGLVQQEPIVHSGGNEANKFQTDSQGSKIGLASGKWNNFCNGLYFMPVSEMPYGAASLDAVNNAPLSTYVSFVSWTWGAGNGTVRAAVRNGSEWFISDTRYAANYVNGGEPKPIFVPDVAAETWFALAVDPAVHLAAGAETDGSGFTDITAMGWYFDNVASAYVDEMEVKISGAQPSYDYWASNSGLVSSNSAAMDDPDMDGLSNEKEYAFGGDPLVADTATLPVLDMTIQSEPGTGNDVVTYVYNKQRDPSSGISYDVKTTTDLVNFPWTSGSYTSVETELDYYWMVVTNYIPITTDTTFLKVDID